MPMHDWRRVEPNIYHHFHTKWLGAVDGALNRGVLPPDFYSLVEQVTANVVADVLTLQRPGAAPPRPPARAAHAVPAVGLVERAAPARPRTPKRVAVRHTSNHRVVAVVELASPANKASRRDLRAFVGKAAALLADGVHLLVIDPFAPGPRDPAGLHPLIWKAATRPRKRRVPYTPPADRPLAVLSYAADPGEVVATVDAFAAGGPVPAGPLYLGPAGYVSVPLDECYRAAFAEVPAVWRAELGG